MVAYDSETTGVDVESDRIVTATVVRVNAPAVDSTTWLIDPGIDIPAEATAVHGITTEWARSKGRPPAECLDLVAGNVARALSRGTPVVGMNLAYDLTILDRDCRRHGVPNVEDRLDGKPFAPIVDVFVIDKHIDRYRKGSRKLTDLCDFYQARLDGAHDSAFDALAAARLAWRFGQFSHLPAADLRAKYASRRDPNELVRAWHALGRLTLDELHAAQVRWYAEQTESLGIYWRQLAEQKRAEADRDEATDEQREIALQEATELEARIDALDPTWPVRPYAVHEVLTP